MTLSIPASAIVNVNPGVIGAGGTGLDLNGLFLTASTRVPIGTAQSFATTAAVADYFGASSAEAAQAAVYFGGFDNSNIKPGALLFAQYPWTAAVKPYLRGGDLSALTLTQLRAITGTLIVTINGEEWTSGAIDLSAVSSFSDAAQEVEDQLAAFDAVVTGSIALTTLTVTAVASGTLRIGQELSGTGVTAGTKITALGSGTGGTGTYTVDTSQTASSTAISAGPAVVTYDSVSGAFIVTGGTPGVAGTISIGSGTIAAGLKLTTATGAVTSQGAAIATPGTAMDAIAVQTQDWASFSTMFEPITDDKVAFAAWCDDQDNRYLYVCWDTSSAPTVVPDTTSAGALILAAEYAGTALVYEPSDLGVAAFLMGSIASIDFAELNGRSTLAFKAQSGLTPGVTSQTIADNLMTNGYNFYGAYATAADRFVFFYPGQVTGDFRWIDSYVNQIWFNNALQLALITLLTQAKSIPYNAAGYSLIDAACADPINAALNFGAIRPGVTLSALQAAEVNAAAGIDITRTLNTRGWFLQVKDATAIVRAARGSPPVTLWYMDGQSVQSINLASINIQ